MLAAESEGGGLATLLVPRLASFDSGLATRLVVRGPVSDSRLGLDGVSRQELVRVGGLAGKGGRARPAVPGRR